VSDSGFLWVCESNRGLAALRFLHLNDGAAGVRTQFLQNQLSTHCGLTANQQPGIEPRVVDAKKKLTVAGEKLVFLLFMKERTASAKKTQSIRKLRKKSLSFSILSSGEKLMRPVWLNKRSSLVDRSLWKHKISF